MRLTFLTRWILFSSLAAAFISGMTGTGQGNILQQVDHNHGIKSNMDDNRTTLPKVKDVTSKPSMFSKQKHNEAGEYKSNAPVKNDQRRSAIINKQNLARKNLLLSYYKPTIESVTKQSMSKPGAIVKKQFISRIYPGFPGGAWVQDGSLPRAAYSTSKGNQHS